MNAVFKSLKTDITSSAEDDVRSEMLKAVNVYGAGCLNRVCKVA